MHKNTIHTRKRREKYKEQGKCYCGRDIDNKNYKQCTICRTRYTPEQERERAKEYRAKIPKEVLIETWRRSKLKAAHGLTPAQFDEKLLSQGGVCYICKGQPTGKKVFYVDHNHTTGKIRDLLCGRCNSAIGMIREDVETLEKIKKYLISYL